MELFNLRWIFKNHFLGAVFRRWYVVLAAFAGLWGTLEIWTRKKQKIIIGIGISIIIGFLLLLPLLFFHQCHSSDSQRDKGKIYQGFVSGVFFSAADSFFLSMCIRKGEQSSLQRIGGFGPGSSYPLYFLLNKRSILKRKIKCQAKKTGKENIPVHSYCKFCAPSY